LLQKKADIYSARFPLFFVSDLVGWRDMMVFTSDLKELKEARNLLLADVGSSSSLNKIAPLLENETRHFVQRILDAPSSEKLGDHVRL
jgi:hypothetical protein